MFVAASPPPGSVRELEFSDPLLFGFTDVTSNAGSDCAADCGACDHALVEHATSTNATTQVRMMRAPILHGSAGTFQDGRSTRSITSVSTRARVACSLRPSCCRTA